MTMNESNNIFAWIKDDKNSFYTQILPLILICVVGISVIKFSEKEIPDVKKNEVDDYLLGGEKTIRRAIFEMKNPIQCSADVSFSRVSTTTKTDDGYIINYVDKIIKSDVKQPSSKDGIDFCKPFIDEVMNRKTDKVVLKLLSDNRTLIDVKDDSIYMCIADGASRVNCEYNSLNMSAKKAQDGCIEYIDDSSLDGVKLSGYMCKNGFYRSEEPLVEMNTNAFADGVKFEFSIKNYASLVVN